MRADIGEILRNNSYPGRGIIVGVNEGGALVTAYFIMGRSENSRNRVFVESDGGIVTQPADPAKVVDPSLIIYTPVRVFGNNVIVTNGDHTDTIYKHLVRGGDFATALRSRTFEPDPPHYTPRISALLRVQPQFNISMSIIKSDGGRRPQPVRYFFEYPSPRNGTGYFLSTYRGDGRPLPSFEGEPVMVDLPDMDINELTSWLWESLNPENRVSLYVRTMDTSVNIQSTISNQYGQDLAGGCNDSV